jgi:outer membrane biosynthesis protein TonB
MTPESTQTGSRVAGKKTRRRQSTSPVPEDHDPDDVELQLKDIPDFPLRSKVAQLMAVAPAFSVSQLYHPLVDKEGHFETAKEYIMPKSPANLNASYLATSVKRQVVLSQSSNSNPTQDPYDDQVMVKIDWDNSDLLFDNDAPSFLFPEPKKSKKKPTKKTPQPRAISKPKKQQTKKQPQPKKRAPPQKPSSTKAPPKKPHASHSTTAHTNKAASPFAPPPRPASIPTEPSSKIQTRATHARANTSVKRRAHTPPRSSAHTTINDSDFLVPDEHVLSDSDQSYINSDAVDESEGSGDESD